MQRAERLLSISFTSHSRCPSMIRRKKMSELGRKQDDCLGWLDAKGGNAKMRYVLELRGIKDEDAAFKRRSIALYACDDC